MWCQMFIRCHCCTKIQIQYCVDTTDLLKFFQSLWTLHILTKDESKKEGLAKNIIFAYFQFYHNVLNYAEFNEHL